jgi:hypothetical protein
MKNPQRVNRLKLAAALTISATAFAADVTQAHHSLAMFDQGHPIEIAGTVLEFRYTSPHTFILLDVEDPDGESTVWSLEGLSPSLLSRVGVSATTIKPGDELVLTVDPLRTGAPGGSWSPNKTWWFTDRRPLISLERSITRSGLPG